MSVPAVQVKEDKGMLGKELKKASENRERCYIPEIPHASHGMHR